MKILSEEEIKTNIETQKHIDLVRSFIDRLQVELYNRAENHDRSKLEKPEVTQLVDATKKLKSLTYGSKEYSDILNTELKEFKDHHYSNNSHHPEFYDNGIEGMDLVDVVEMLCDWRAATERHENGDIYKSLEINRNRFLISDQLMNILKNTVDRYFST